MIQPFKARVSQDAVADLRARLARTRWPEVGVQTGWSEGVDAAYLREVCRYWAETYDWRAFESRFNAFAQGCTEIDGQRLHFYHVRSPEPAARALILSHGWPGSVVEFHKVLGPLSDPRAHGGDPADAFHVVAPSLPGFGFSGPTLENGWNSLRIARVLDALMDRLGYGAYFAQGGDKGAMVSLQLAAQFPARVLAIHLNILPPLPPDGPDPMAGVSEAEKAALQANADFAAVGSGYQAVQRTRPLTLAYGLTDSPAGLAAWLLDKFHAWSDGDPEASIGRDRLLDNLSLYWLTGTIGSSVRYYFEDHGPGRQLAPPVVKVPVGHTVFPAEIIKTPRAWAASRYDLRRWTYAPAGGHFAAMEVPDIFVEEVRRFFRDL